MDLVIFGDTHELHREVEVPAGDILIFTGDFTMFSKSLRAIEDFNGWLGELPHLHKLVVPGNHEFFLEANPARRSLLSNATVLIDESININRLRLYGSPMTPLYGGAFGKSSPTDRKRHWAKIPDDTDVLITHGPPYGILDRSLGQMERMGDPELRGRIRELPSLRLHVFGHVHGAYGMAEVDGVTFANVALMGHLGDLVNQPTVMRMGPAGRDDSRLRCQRHWHRLLALGSSMLPFARHRTGSPEVARFDGIRITLHKDDHEIPLIHAETQDSGAKYSVPEGCLLVGNLPRLQDRQVQSWMKMEHAATGRTVGDLHYEQ